jgi:hypothetical protein
VGNFNYSDLKNLENGLKGDKGSYQKVKVYPLYQRVFVGLFYFGMLAFTYYQGGLPWVVIWGFAAVIMELFFIELNTRPRL